MFAYIDDDTLNVKMIEFNEKEIQQEDLNRIVFNEPVVNLTVEGNTATVRGANGITFRQFLRGVEVAKRKLVLKGDYSHNFLEGVRRVRSTGVPIYDVEFGS